MKFISSITIDEKINFNFLQCIYKIRKIYIKIAIILVLALTNTRKKVKCRFNVWKIVLTIIWGYFVIWDYPHIEIEPDFYKFYGDNKIHDRNVDTQNTQRRYTVEVQIF